MQERDTFLLRVVAARRAAWQVLLVGVHLQIIVYLGYLAVGHGWVDGLIERGIYGDVTRERLALLVFVFVAVMKLMNTGILLGALFLTLWVRGLRQNP